MKTLFELECEINTLIKKLDSGQTYWSKEEIWRDANRLKELIKQKKSLDFV